MKTFQEIYVMELMPKFPKAKVKDCTKKMNSRDFKRVKGEEEMKEDEERKKESTQC